MPLRNCFQKYWRPWGSPKSKIRLMGSLHTRLQASPNESPIPRQACVMMSTSETSSTVVCRQSVHTMVLMPLYIV